MGVLFATSSNLIISSGSIKITRVKATGFKAMYPIASNTVVPPKPFETLTKQVAMYLRPSYLFTGAVSDVLVITGTRANSL